MTFRIIILNSLLCQFCTFNVNLSQNKSTLNLIVIITVSDVEYLFQSNLHRWTKSHIETCFFFKYVIFIHILQLYAYLSHMLFMYVLNRLTYIFELNKIRRAQLID